MNQNIGRLLEENLMIKSSENQNISSANKKEITSWFPLYLDTFVGIPSNQAFDEFINTAIAIDSLDHDEKVMKELMKRVAEYLTQNNFELA